MALVEDGTQTPDDVGPLGREYLRRLREINRLEGEASALLEEFDSSGSGVSTGLPRVRPG